MKQQRLLIASSGLLAALLAGCSGMPGALSPSPTSSAGPSVRPVALDPAAVGSSSRVPASLRTPLGQSMFLLVSGTGVQVYECAAGSSGGFAWRLVAPESTLTDTSGVAIGKHYAGPTWESTDGSTVVGEVSATSPAPEGSAIPWLLLTVKSTTGTGVFTQTKSIQRLQTVGGTAPASACGGGNAGEKARVPYAATYAFFRVGA